MLKMMINGNRLCAIWKKDMQIPEIKEKSWIRSETTHLVYKDGKRG